MEEARLEHDVFISYSSKDAQVAEAVCRALEEQDITCWIAPRNIPQSMNYGQCIIDAIKGSKALVIIFSRHSNQSKFVAAEIERAFSYGIPIFPFRLEIIPPSPELELFLSTKQWQDAVIPPPLEHHIFKLRDIINRHLGKSELGVVLPTRAVEDIPSVRRFLSCLEEPGDPDYIERLAEAAHTIFCQAKLREGWTLGPRDELKKTSPLLRPYAELNELAKEAKRTKVRFYPAMLAALGYKLVDAPGEQPLMLPGDELEELAELEHSIYRMGKLDEGFSPGMATDANPKLLPALVEWEHLRENIKSINRGLVWELQKIVAKAGFTVEKVLP
jgi:hypothetical protein